MDQQYQANTLLQIEFNLKRENKEKSTSTDTQTEQTQICIRQKPTSLAKLDMRRDSNPNSLHLFPPLHLSQLRTLYPSHNLISLEGALAVELQMSP